MAQWGAEDGRNGTKESIMMNDCFPCDSASFGTFNVSGGKIAERGHTPHTVHMFTIAARQQSRFFAASYGRGHLAERLEAVGRMNEIHEECPEFFTASFLTEMWGRMVYQYNVCVAE